MASKGERVMPKGEPVIHGLQETLILWRVSQNPLNETDFPSKGMNDFVICNYREYVQTNH